MPNAWPEVTGAGRAASSVIDNAVTRKTAATTRARYISLEVSLIRLRLPRGRYLSIPLIDASLAFRLLRRRRWFRRFLRCLGFPIERGKSVIRIFRIVGIAAIAGALLLNTRASGVSGGYVETDLVVNQEVGNVPTLTD